MQKAGSAASGWISKATPVKEGPDAEGKSRRHGALAYPPSTAPGWTMTLRKWAGDHSLNCSLGNRRCAILFPEIDWHLGWGIPTGGSVLPLWCGSSQLRAAALHTCQTIGQQRWPLLAHGTESTRKSVRPRRDAAELRVHAANTQTQPGDRERRGMQRLTRAVPSPSPAPPFAVLPSHLTAFSGLIPLKITTLPAGWVKGLLGRRNARTSKSMGCLRTLSLKGILRSLARILGARPFSQPISCRVSLKQVPCQPQNI